MSKPNYAQGMCDCCGIHSFILLPQVTATGLANLCGPCRDAVLAAQNVPLPPPPPPPPRRTVKKFLVQFEGNEITRWDEIGIEHALIYAATRIAKDKTEGDIPQIFVTKEP